MIRKMLLVAAVAVLAVPFGSFGAKAEDKAAFDDAVFVKKAVMGGMSEVYLSELAATQCKNVDVKKFASQLLKDHSASNEALLAAAKSASIEVPTKLDGPHQKQYDGFKNYKGDNFDRDYVKTIVQSHNACVALYTQASKEANNPTIKDYATKTLPLLQKHLETAKNFDK
jgi:putative membrane protein